MNHQSPTIIDYFQLLKKWRKPILANICVITLTTATLALILPKTYTAVSVLMAPQSKGGRMFNSDSDNPLMPLSSLFGNYPDESMNLISIIQSRTVMEKVIDKYKLIDFYKVDNIEEALEELEDASEFEVEEEGTIHVSISITTGWFHLKEDENIAKKLCTEIANTFVSELDELNKSLNVERASFHRKFIEQRYLQNIKDLHNAEEELKSFQKNNDLVSIDDQTESAIESASIIKRKILLDQIQLEILKEAFIPEHNKIEQLKKEIEKLKIQLDEIKNGSVNEESDNKLFITISEIPDLGLTHLRLQRELEIQTERRKFLHPHHRDDDVE